MGIVTYMYVRETWDCAPPLLSSPQVRPTWWWKGLPLSTKIWWHTTGNGDVKPRSVMDVLNKLWSIVVVTDSDYSGNYRPQLIRADKV
jgi:hypothetical protein